MAGQRFQLARREAHTQCRLVAPGHDSMGSALLGWALAITTALLCCQLCIPKLEVPVPACVRLVNSLTRHTPPYLAEAHWAIKVKLIQCNLTESG